MNRDVTAELTMRSSPILTGVVISLSGFLVAASPTPLLSFSLETSLRDSTTRQVFAKESYSASSKVLNNTHQLALDVYEDLELIGDCREVKCEYPGPIKERIPRICFGLRSHGELVDHGPVRTNVNVIENRYTDSVREVIVEGPIEGGPIKLRGGPPGSVLEIICGGSLERLRSPDTNANVNAGPVCIAHGGSLDARELRLDSTGYQFVAAGSCMTP